MENEPQWLVDDSDEEPTLPEVKVETPAPRRKSHAKRRSGPKALALFHKVRDVRPRLSRPSRERLISYLIGTGIVLGSTAGIVAWSRDEPTPPPQDPGQPYVSITGFAEQYWSATYGGGVVLYARHVTSTYWDVVVRDDHGCWDTTVVIVKGAPAMGGPPAPLACASIDVANVPHGDVVPVSDPAGKVASEFLSLWLTGLDYERLTAANVRIPPLGDHPFESLGAQLYWLEPGTPTDAHFWAEGSFDGHTFGVVVDLANNGRWEITGAHGNPPVGSDIGVAPTTSTSSSASPTIPTTSTTAKAVPTTKPGAKPGE